MNTRATDGNIAVKFDRTIPLWGIIGVCGSIFFAAVTGYIQVDRLTERTATLTEQVKALTEAQLTKRETELQSGFKVLTLEGQVKSIESTVSELKQRITAVEKTPAK